MAGNERNSVYEIECPACKTTKYRNPHMKLMVNVCGHALCENCVRMLFIKETGQCPECDMVLKRGKFRIQVFEDPLVEKEVDIRRKVARIYNKVEEDFVTCAEYDDYLEDIEHIVHSLTYDDNKLETEKRMETYERQHKDEIKKNYLRKSAADEELDRVVEEERLQVLNRQQEQRREIEKQKQQTQSKRNTSLLKDLMASDGDATQIVRSHAERLRLEKEGQEQEDLITKIQTATSNPKEFSSGVRIGGGATMGPTDAATAAAAQLLMQAEDYVYEAPTLAPRLPLPAWNELGRDGYLLHVRQAGVSARAGGYTEQYACMRALHEFMAGHVLADEPRPASSVSAR